MLATRPLLLSILDRRARYYDRATTRRTELSASLHSLLEASLSSAVKAIQVLTMLLDQDLLGKANTVRTKNYSDLLTEPFLSLDLECTTSAAIVLMLVRFLVPHSVPNYDSYWKGVLDTLSAMKNRGSRPAELREVDIHELECAIENMSVREKGSAKGALRSTYLLASVTCSLFNSRAARCRKFDPRSPS